MGEAQCVECGRRFNLFSDEDSIEWFFGHDCEEA